MKRGPATKAIGKAMLLVGAFTAAWSLVLAVVCISENRLYFYDDTFITMRYARHLIEGLGLRWNTTGAPVEGFSSPLHVLLIAGLGKLGMDLLTASQVIGFCAHIALVVFIFRWFSRSVNVVAACLAAALVTASWPILVWDIGGLDEVLFASLLTMGTLVTLRYLDTRARTQIVRGGLLLGLAGLTRPDAALVAIIALGTCLLLAQVPVRKRCVDVLIAGCAAAAVVLPWEIFRLAYYHALLPNTYYAKVYGIPLGWRIQAGFDYWRTYAGSPPYLALLSFFVAVAVLLCRRATRFDWGIWACILGYACYVLTSGGDHMVAFRFMIPLVSFFAVSLVNGIGELGMLRTPGMALAVSLLLLMVSVRQLFRTAENPRGGDYASVVGVEVARYIARHWPAGSSIAINTVGTTAYFANQMNYIDMLGLNDRQIAMRKNVPMYPETVRRIGHMKGNGESILARRPGFIIPNFPNGRALREGDPVRYFLTEYELLHSPRFAQEYQLCSVLIPVSNKARSLFPELGSSMVLTYYQRRDLDFKCVQVS